MNMESQTEPEEIADMIIQPKPKTNLKGICCVVGGVLLMIYLGCFFLWGNISIYVLSYFY